MFIAKILFLTEEKNPIELEIPNNNVTRLNYTEGNLIGSLNIELDGNGIKNYTFNSLHETWNLLKDINTNDISSIEVYFNNTLINTIKKINTINYSLDFSNFHESIIFTFTY